MLTKKLPSRLQALFPIGCLAAHTSGFTGRVLQHLDLDDLVLVSVRGIGNWCKPQDLTRLEEKIVLVPYEGGQHAA